MLCADEATLSCFWKQSVGWLWVFLCLGRENLIAKVWGVGISHLVSKLLGVVSGSQGSVAESYLEILTLFDHVLYHFKVLSPTCICCCSSKLQIPSLFVSCLLVLSFILIARILSPFSPISFSYTCYLATPSQENSKIGVRQKSGEKLYLWIKLTKSWVFLAFARPNYVTVLCVTFLCLPTPGRSQHSTALEYLRSSEKNSLDPACLEFPLTHLKSFFMLELDLHLSLPVCIL